MKTLKPVVILFCFLLSSQVIAWDKSTPSEKPAAREKVERPVPSDREKMKSMVCPLDRAVHYLAGAERKLAEAAKYSGRGLHEKSADLLKDYDRLFKQALREINTALASGMDSKKALVLVEKSAARSVGMLTKIFSGATGNLKSDARSSLRLTERALGSARSVISRIEEEESAAGKRKEIKKAGQPQKHKKTPPAKHIAEPPGKKK